MQRSAGLLLGILTLTWLVASACGTDSAHPSSDSARTATPARFATTAPTAAGEAQTTPIAGRAPAQVVRVIDGDTIEVRVDSHSFRVRYIGIDTPETVDPRRPVGCFGREASQRNRELVDGKTVLLEKDVSETDDFGRLLRYVWLAEEMVNATLVQEGYAVSSTYPPDVKYQDLFLSLQREAREAGRGLWSACAGPSPTAAAGTARCAFSSTGESMIKGNISQRTGEKTYHVPGGEFYDRTVIDEAAGERWFCTEQEAIDAGWRRSKR